MYQETDWFDIVFPNIKPNTTQITKDGMIRDSRGIHKPDYISSNGYVYTFLSMKDGTLTLQPFDVIMATTFLPITRSLVGKEVIPKHLNGNTSDCSLENLQWVEDIEEWRDVILDGKHLPWYQVSNHGNVRSKLRDNEWKLMKLVVDRARGGYIKISICVSQSYRRKVSVHRLVAEAFIPGRTTERNTINHINNVHTHNHVLNLEWVTDRENHDHANMIGRGGAYGVDNPNSKITEEQAMTICHVLNQYNGCIMKTYKLLHDEMPTLSYAMIGAIKYGDTFTYISDQLLTKAGRTKQERQTDPDVILKAAMLLKKYNGDVAKTKKEFEQEFPWVTLGWLWHLKDKSVAADITDQVFQKDEFPKTVPLTEETAMMIINSLLAHKNDQFINKVVFDELKDKIPGLTRDKVRSIKEKKSWKELSDKYFTKDEFIQ